VDIYIGAMKIMNCLYFFQNICKAHNGNLIKIENAVENWFIKSVVTGKIKTIILIIYWLCKKSLTIPKRKSEAVKWRSDNKMAKRQNTQKEYTERRKSSSSTSVSYILKVSEVTTRSFLVWSNNTLIPCLK
jgi:hypothetical protein